MRDPLPRPAFCYQPVVAWNSDETSIRSVVPCKRPVYRSITVAGIVWGHVCFDHSPNARRPKPEGR